jgi:hypothetical protein
MTKTLNQIIFFPPPKSEYFFQQHWESEYFFFLEKTTPWKLNGPSLSDGGDYKTLLTANPYMNQRTYPTCIYNL